VLSHGHNLRDNRFTSPLNSKDLGKFPEVMCGGFSDGEDSIAQPPHAETAQLLVEELDAQLACQKWDVIDNSKPYTPLLVFGKLNNSWEQRLGEEIDANNLVHQLQFGNDVESDFREFVLQHL